MHYRAKIEGSAPPCGKVLGPVIGAYGEMSDDVYIIAEAVA